MLFRYLRHCSGNHLFACFNAICHFRKMRNLLKYFKAPSSQSARKAMPYIAIVTMASILFLAIFFHESSEKKEKVEPEKKISSEQSAMPFGAVIEGLKGVDLSELKENDKIRALKLLNIVSCLASDGGMSVARCRRDVPHCVTSQRMADYITHLVGKGLDNEEIMASLYEKAIKENGAKARLDEKRWKIPKMDLPMLGSPESCVQVTLFYDYTSGFSHRAWEEVVGLHHLYPKRVRVVLWPSPRSSLEPKA